MTTKEIQDYLNTIKFILDSGGRLIIQFNRQKNTTFQYLYQINKRQVEEVLRSLTIEDFKKKELSKNEHFVGRELYFFSPTRTFTASNGRLNTMKLYIKIDLYEEDKLIVVLSFHEYGDFSEEEDRND